MTEEVPMNIVGKQEEEQEEEQEENIKNIKKTHTSPTVTINPEYNIVTQSQHKESQSLSQSLSQLSPQSSQSSPFAEPSQLQLQSPLELPQKQLEQPTTPSEKKENLVLFPKKYTPESRVSFINPQQQINIINKTKIFSSKSMKIFLLKMQTISNHS